jgi:hypothetical protein
MSHAVCIQDVGVITEHQLGGYLGKSMADICQNGYVSPSENQGAHFVAHVLGYGFGMTCAMTSAGKAPGATLQARELFSRCRKVGAWSLRPAAVRACLVFISRASDVSLSSKAMANAPRTHVGILLDGYIWHYSKNLQKVVREPPSQFARHYPAPDNALFFGTLP